MSISQFLTLASICYSPMPKLVNDIYNIYNQYKKEIQTSRNSYDNGIDIKYEIKNFRFSSHSRKKEIKRIVDELNSDTVMIVHGDRNSSNLLGSSILSKYSDKRITAPNKNRAHKMP